MDISKGADGKLLEGLVVFRTLHLWRVFKKIGLAFALESGWEDSLDDPSKLLFLKKKMLLSSSDKSDIGGIYRHPCQVYLQLIDDKTVAHKG